MAKYIGINALTYLVALIKTALTGKVDAVPGKTLSTNDYTTAEKAKLAGIAAGANSYTLPAATASALGGVKVGTGLVVVNGVLSASGGGTADGVAWQNVTGKPESFPPASHAHAYAGSASAGGAANSALACTGNAETATKLGTSTVGSATRPIYLNGGTPTQMSYTIAKSVPGNAVFTDTTYEEATPSTAGLLPAADKAKLDGITIGSGTYSLPIASAGTLGGIKVGENLSISNGVLSAADTTYEAATSDAAGLMSAADKSSLDSLTAAVTTGAAIASVGDTLTWTVNATGGAGVKEYSFKVYRDAVCRINSPWTQNPSYSYLASDAGEYRVLAYVRDSAGTASAGKWSAYTTVSDTQPITFTGVTPRVAGANAAKTTESVTLPATEWSGNSQGVVVYGVTPANTVVISPEPTSHDAYADAGIYCIAQSRNALTFSCSSVPSADLGVNILILT